MPWELIAVLFVNVVVGLLVGWSSIAGFLIPIFYVGVLGFEPTSALALSFFAFALAAATASVHYYKAGDLPLNIALPLASGSVVGAVFGVLLNSLIPPNTVKLLMYFVVLTSGISILFREYRAPRRPLNDGRVDPLENKVVGASLGFITAVVCALAGAGGPILVMPLLVVLGVPLRWAIGVAIFDSLFIAIPSAIGYGLQVDLSSIWPFLVVGGASHMLGALVGSWTSRSIPHKWLKTSVAIFSIAVSLYMILTALL